MDPIQERSDKCNEQIIRRDIFDNDLSDLIQEYCNSRPVPFESIVTGLITVSSIFCSKSVVDIKKCFTQPICFYSVFAGPVSSRKSTCISLFKDTYDNAVNIINKYNDPDNKACLQAYSNCNITIESLLKELDEKGSIMQFWDEFQTFLSTFGLYKSNVDFDKTIVLTVYNSENRFTYNLKSYVYVIPKPRLSIFTAGHEWKIVDMIENEKKITADGFISRFLITCPKPVEFSYDSLRHVNSLVNFEKIFIAIRFFHLNEAVYILEPNAYELFKVEAESYDRVCRKHEKTNILIGSIYGKLSGQLLRLCGIIHILEETMKELKKMDEELIKNEVEFIQTLKSMSISKEMSEITVKKAIEINRYYINQKLLLAGYLSSETLETFADIKQNKQSVKISRQNIPSLEQKILLYQGSVVFLCDISKNNRECRKENFEKLTRIFESQNLGNLKFARPTESDSRKASTCFVKKKFDALDENSKLEFINTLLNYNISIDEYNKSCIPEIPIVQISDDESSQNSITNRSHTLRKKRKNDNENEDEPSKRLNTSQ